MDAGIKADCVLLNDNLLLDQRVDLLLQEVAFIDVVCLKLLVVFLQVGDVFNDLLEDVVSSLSCMMLKRGALASEQLNFLLVVVQQLDSFFGVPL